MSADVAHTVAELSRSLQARAPLRRRSARNAASRRSHGRDRQSTRSSPYSRMKHGSRHVPPIGKSPAGRYRGPLHGVPISLKDLIDLRGMPTSAASRVRRGHVAAHDAVVSARLRAAGAVFVGKTNLHEFALGTTNEDSAYGPVHHPLDPLDLRADRPAGRPQRSWPTCVTPRSVQTPAARFAFRRLRAAGRSQAAFGEIPLDGVVPLSSTLRSRRAAVPVSRGCRPSSTSARRRVEPAHSRREI
jgi:hypothetical protein